jgi:tetratricopeptide (TPR) repeat protein
MFEFGRGLRRLFQSPDPVHGLTMGDASALELLDLRLLQSEARGADVAAGRIGAKDRALRLCEASAAWREVARRTGDPAALRKSAAAAEQGATLARAADRRPVLARSLCEQVQTAFVGADLFGEDGLNVAADYLLGQAGAAPMAQGLRAVLGARQSLVEAPLAGVRTASAAFDRVLAAHKGRTRPEVAAAVRLRCERAEFLTFCGARLGEPQLIEQALADLATACNAADGAHHPLTASRALELRGLALLRLGEFRGDPAPILEGLDAFAMAIDLIAPDHSPLDWARLHHGQGQAFTALGETGESDIAFQRALQAFDKAAAVLGNATHLALRAAAAQDRAACLVRRAEARGDGFALDEAEAILRGELANLARSPDPVAWAVLQLNLARVYMAQSALGGRRRNRRAQAGEALLAALEVFSERGLRSLAAMTDVALRELREASTAALRRP